MCAVESQIVNKFDEIKKNVKNSGQKIYNFIGLYFFSTCSVNNPESFRRQIKVA